MKVILLIAAGGAAGAVLRYAVSGLVQSAAGSGFPAGTLAVNLIGCLMIGVLGAIFAGPYVIPEAYRAAVLIGLLGSFTTFSTVGWETFELLNSRQWTWAGLNLLLSNAVGIAGVWLGYRLTEHWVGV